MKEATGELNMTVITVVALAAVAALLYVFVWPMIKARIVQQTCDMMGEGYTAHQAGEGTDCSATGCVNAEEDDAGGTHWCCCPATNSTSSPTASPTTE